MIRKISLETEKYVVKDVLDAIHNLHRTASIAENDVFSFNGLEGVSGWNVLNDLRKKCQNDDLGCQFVIVRTHRLLLRFGEIGEYKDIDLVRERSRSMFYWFEFADMKSSQSPWIGRRFIQGFQATAISINETTSKKYTVIIPCAEEEYSDMRDTLERAESVFVEGMVVDVSLASKKEHDFWLITQIVEPVPMDYQRANNILSVMSSWKEIAPMRKFSIGKKYVGDTIFDFIDGRVQEPLLFFPEIVSLAIMVSVLFTREGVPVFNTFFFGGSNIGKTSALRYIVVKMLHGEIESGSSSAGKGWLITHARDAPVPKIFSQKNALLVNEAFKSVSHSQSNHHSYTIQLKMLLEKHMEVLERTPVSSSSGLGTVRGKLVCSFVATENDDDSLIKALGRVFCMASANTRRIQIGYIYREDETDVDSEVNTELAHKMMTAWLNRKFGHEALRSIKELYLYSRKFTENLDLEAPNEWKKEMRERMKVEVEHGWITDPDMPKWFSVGAYDAATHKEFSVYVDQFLYNQRNILTPCYISAAIFRGWEVYSNILELKPVYDERQRKMAEDLVMYFTKCKFKLFSGGIEETVMSGGVRRQPYGGN